VAAVRLLGRHTRDRKRLELPNRDGGGVQSTTGGDGPAVAQHKSARTALLRTLAIGLGGIGNAR
jgi:hypothetical protein